MSNFDAYFAYMNDEQFADDPIFPEADIRFATFGNRLGASLLDGLILSCITLPVTYFNVTTWKVPVYFILTSLLEIIYKPLMEWRYGATLGKMAVNLKVVGPNYEKLTLSRELRRVSFYMIPSILQLILIVHVYFSAAFISIRDFKEYNQFIVDSNPATLWLSGIVLALGTADCIFYFMNGQRQALHDMYAGTFVVEKD